MNLRATWRAALLATALWSLPLAAQEPSPEDLPSSPNPLAGLSLESLSATRELPLFTPSRSAPVAEAAPEPPPAPEPEPKAPIEAAAEPPPLRLIGLVLTGAEQLAILSNEGTGETQRLRPGEEVEGWKLEIVDARTVALQSGDQKHTLKMFEPGTQPPPAPGARTPIPEEALMNPPAMFGGETVPEGEPTDGAQTELGGGEGAAEPAAEDFGSMPTEDGEAVPEGEYIEEQQPEPDSIEAPPPESDPQEPGAPMILDNSGDPQP